MGHQSFWKTNLLSRWAATQQICIQRLSPKNKGGFPYITFRAGYRNGGYSLSHTWSHIISLAILTSGARWPFSGLTPPNNIPQFHFFLFYCCTHYLALSPFPLLPSSHSPFFDAWTHFWVKEHHLDLEVYIFTVLLHGQQLSSWHIYLSFDI
jgi:hypothetical protein